MYSIICIQFKIQYFNKVANDSFSMYTDINSARFSLKWVFLISFFHMWLFSFPNITCQRLSFLHFLASFVVFFIDLFIFDWRIIALQNCICFYQTSRWISLDHRSMTLFLGSLFCSIDLCTCFCARIMGFWLLSFNSIIWYLEEFYLQLSSFS